MPISPFGAAHVAATLAALPGAAIVVIGRRVAASIDRGDDRWRTPLLRVWFMAIRRGWCLPAAGAARDLPPMTLRDRPMRRESLLSEKKLA